MTECYVGSGAGARGFWSGLTGLRGHRAGCCRSSQKPQGAKRRDWRRGSRLGRSSRSGCRAHVEREPPPRRLSPGLHHVQAPGSGLRGLIPSLATSLRKTHRGCPGSGGRKYGSPKRLPGSWSGGWGVTQGPPEAGGAVVALQLQWAGGGRAWGRQAREGETANGAPGRSSSSTAGGTSYCQRLPPPPGGAHRT